MLMIWHPVFAQAGEESQTSNLYESKYVKNKTVVVTVVSWNNHVGELNGVSTWKQGGYNYRKKRFSKKAENYPSSSFVGYPKHEINIESKDYLSFVREGATEELRLMKEAGIDVAAFDMLPMPEFDMRKPLTVTNTPFAHFLSFLEWEKAANNVQMKVCILADLKNVSSDYPRGRLLDEQQWIKNINYTLDYIAGLTSIWRISEKPVLFHFGSHLPGNRQFLNGSGDSAHYWIRIISTVRERDRDLFFVPDVRLYSEISLWERVADGLYVFGPAAPSERLVDLNEKLSNKTRKVGVWSVSPGYYSPKLKVFTEPSFERIHDFYMNAIDRNVSVINLLTWNDYYERTDIRPTKLKGRALLELFGFYNRWYKSGIKPKLENSKIIIAYPASIPRTVSSRGPNWGDGGKEYKPNIYYWSNLESKVDIELLGIGKFDLSKGLSMGELGYMKPGELVIHYKGKEYKYPASISVENESENLDYRYIVI